MFCIIIIIIIIYLFFFPFLKINKRRNTKLFEKGKREKGPCSALANVHYAYAYKHIRSAAAKKTTLSKIPNPAP